MVNSEWHWLTSHQRGQTCFLPPLAIFPHNRTTVAWRGESSRAVGLEKARRAFILDMELWSTLTMPSTDFPSYLEMAIIVSHHALR